MSEQGTAKAGWSDQRLIDSCLAGDEAAWSALVDKYKNLVYSIVLKYGADPDEAADLFQAVWLDAFNDLPKIRNKGAAKSWLATLASHKCYHWKQKRVRQDYREIDGLEAEELEVHSVQDPDFVEELERDQLVREAVFELKDRCREMIQLLFFANPPLPYRDVAEKLGLAVGSIGFIRGRCLKQLQKLLEKKGW